MTDIRFPCLFLCLLLTPVFLFAGNKAGLAASTVKYSVTDRPAETTDPAHVGPPNGLPDGLITRSSDGRLRGWLTGPTKRYDHGVLGDAIEAAGFRVLVKAASGPDKTLDYLLPEDFVLEDRRLRFWDINDDGQPEVVAIKSGFKGGGRIAAWSVNKDQITPLAESVAIGRAYRWLNLIAAADFDGDGRTEIAAVITPHLGVVLRLFRLEGNLLKPVYDAHGFSNHGIGMRAQQLSAVTDVNGDGVPDLIVPNASRTSIRIVTFAGGEFRELQNVPLGGNIVGNMELVEELGIKTISFPLDNGKFGILTIQ